MEKKQTINVYELPVQFQLLFYKRNRKKNQYRINFKLPVDRDSPSNLESSDEMHKAKPNQSCRKSWNWNLDFDPFRRKHSPCGTD